MQKHSLKMEKRMKPIWISLFLLLIFTIYYLFSNNFEFLTYVLALGIVLFIIFKTDKIFKYLPIARWGFTIWMFLHLAGGSFNINGTRLYDIVLIKLIGEPFNILRYDQIVHTFCYFILTLFIYSVVISVSNKKIANKTMLLIVFLAGIGIGAINEIIEFLTVALFNAKGVGDYFNNSLDLIFNSIGAILAVLYSRKNF